MTYLNGATRMLRGLKAANDIYTTLPIVGSAPSGSASCGVAVLVGVKLVYSFSSLLVNLVLVTVLVVLTEGGKETCTF